MLSRIKLLGNLIIRNVRQRIVLSQVASHKGEIFVGRSTRLSKNTYLGKNPTFNWLTV